MANQKNTDEGKDLVESNKGTLFSVGVVAAVIFINYIIFFWLYTDRM